MLSEWVLREDIAGIKEKVLKQYSAPSIKKHPKVEFNSSLKIIEKNSAYLKKKKIHDYIKNWTKLRYFHFSKKFISFLILLIKLLFNYPLRTLYHVFNSGTRRFLHENNIKK